MLNRGESKRFNDHDRIPDHMWAEILETAIIRDEQFMARLRVEADKRPVAGT